MTYIDLVTKKLTPHDTGSRTEHGGLPAFIGDLLLSWQLKTEVDLPAAWHPGVYPGQDKDHAAGLAQKMVIVRSYLMVAWAGSHADATRIVKALDQILPQTLSELSEPTPVFDILNTCPEGTELVALLVWEKTIRPLGVRTRGFELEGKRIYLMGSGAPDFFEFLQMHPEAIPDSDSADGLVARGTMLRFAARALTLQLVLGAGLENSWGGGFEIVYPDAGGFRKLDKLLFRAWMIDETGDYHNSGRSFFVKYYGSDLHLSWFNPEERVSARSVSRASLKPENRISAISLSRTGKALSGVSRPIRQTRSVRNL